VREYEREKSTADTSLDDLEEGEDYVRCQVCGMAAKSLSSHIRVHGLNWVEYARKFPGFSLWSRKSYEYRRARLQETHRRAGITEKDFAPYTDENGDLVVAAAAKGLKFSQGTIREYAKLLDVPTRNRLSAQKQVLDLISGVLGERYVWEWSDDRVRSPDTGALLYYDGFFRRHNLLVEYHGPQHFQFVPRWHRTPEGFDRQQDIDRYKARRAEELGIELVVVRHTDDISEENLRSILQNRVGYQERQQRREAAAEAAMERLRGSDFPLPEQPSPEEASEVLEKLRRLRQREEEGIVLPRSYTGNALCRRYFPNIYKARRKGHPSAVECWENDQELRRAVLTQIDAGHPTTPERVLKALTFHHRLPAVFRPAFARFIYEKFARPGDLVWDPCSGYGGRLLGAAAARVRYIGTDIEPETVEGNLALAADIGYKADVRLVSALDADIPEVALVFTCPPYFDMEQYSDREGQPHVSYDGRSDWIERFLFPLVGRASGALSTGGRLVFVLPDDLHVASSPEILRKGFVWDAEIGFELPNGKVSKAVAYRKK